VKFLLRGADCNSFAPLSGTHTGGGLAPTVALQTTTTL
jgi:hypothetical protein